MKLFRALLLPLLVGCSCLVHAAIIGTNVPAPSLTLDRITTLPPDQQPAWRDYLARSEKQKAIDQAALQAELKALGRQEPVIPGLARDADDLSLDQPAAWYGSNEALRTAGIIKSFQSPAGGWSKNLNMTRHPRAPGEAFAPDNNNRFPSPGDFDQAADPHWHYVGTFDNDATITQMRFLAKVVTAGGSQASPYRETFLRGLEYSLNAQFPNGGWPQVWPLEGSYHDTITINDDAMLHVLALMHDVAVGNPDYAWVPADERARAAASYDRGLACLLATQIREPNGRRTVWCQQHDALTLAPASGRNYEMPSATSSESASIVLFLMELPHPNAQVVTAVQSAVAWFKQTQIMGITYKNTGKAGRKRVATPGAGPTWARYYELGTDRPIFGDRDQTIHDDVNELSLERRNGYGWYRNTPIRVLEQYPAWSKVNGG